MDWKRFALLARERDVECWIDHLLQRASPPIPIEPEACRVLAGWRYKCRMDNVLLLAAFDRALETLAEIGVRPLLLKGVDLLHRFNLPFDSRTLSDIDLLVAPAEFESSRSALEARGWRTPDRPTRSHWPGYHLPLTLGWPVPVVLELHWDLLQRRRYEVDTDELLARSEDVRLEYGHARLMPVDDLVAYLLLHHHSHHSDRGLKRLVDLRHVIHHCPVDWNTVAAGLRAWRGTSAGAAALTHLEKVFVPSVLGSAGAWLPRVPAWKIPLVAWLSSRHALDRYCWTNRRWVQVWLGFWLLDNPARLPWILFGRPGDKDHMPGEDTADASASKEA